MTPKDPIIFLDHIIENIDHIEKFVSEIKLRDFKKDLLRRYAVFRALEIIGEATTNIPNEIKFQYPSTSWRDILDTRNVLIHQYFNINISIIWEIIHYDLPLLKKQILFIKKELKK